MYKGKTILAVIPARGRSRRLPHKNLKLIKNKPLIAYTIQAALSCTMVDRTIVSTDSSAIGKTALRYSAEWLPRPARLSRDNTHTTPVLLHALQELERNEGYVPDVVVMLQPTTPLRGAYDIKQALATYFKTKCGSVVSVYPDSPYWHLQYQPNQRVKPVLGWNSFKKQQQQLPRAYRPNGAIYISTPRLLHRYGGFYHKNMALYIMPYARSIDIDEEVDLEFINFLLTHGFHKNI